MVRSLGEDCQGDTFGEESGERTAKVTHVVRSLGEGLPRRHMWGGVWGKDCQGDTCGEESGGRTAKVTHVVRSLGEGLPR